jgi:hypothetical protein
MNDENVWIWMESDVAYFKVLIPCSSVETEEN